MLDFNHLPKEFLEQMIPHMKALIQGCDLLNKNTFFGEFEIWRPITFEPADLRKSYIPQKKTFFISCLKATLRLEEFLPWNAPDKF